MGHNSNIDNSADMLCSIKRLKNSYDEVYYVVRDQNSGASTIVSSSCNYLFGPINSSNQILGINVYANSQSLSEQAKKSFPQKKLLFQDKSANSPEEFYKLCVKVEDEQAINQSSFDIQSIKYARKFDIKPKFSSPFTPCYSCYNASQVIDIYEPRSVLKKIYNQIKEPIDYICKTFDISLDNLGITGSTALGHIQIYDFDLIFYGTLDEIKRLDEIVRQQIVQNGFNIKNSFVLPFSFSRNDTSFDCAYVYTDIDLSYLAYSKTVKQNQKFKLRVANDKLTFGKIPILGVNDTLCFDKKPAIDGVNTSCTNIIKIDSIVIMDSLFHAVFRYDDIIEGTGDIIKYKKNGQTRFSIVLHDPLKQIYEFEKFFTEERLKKLL